MKGKSRREQIGAATRRPAPRTRGITKRTELTPSGEIDRAIRAGARAPRKDARSVDGKTKLSELARPIPSNGTQGWTADQDVALCAHFRANPRTAIAKFAKESGIKRGVVKQRVKRLGLLNVPSPAESAAGEAAVERCKHGTVVTADTACEACLKELDAQIDAAPAAPKKRAKDPIAVMCPQGDERLEILHRGKRGFTVVSGASPEKVYGAGPRGYPMCPQHDVEMIAAEPIAAAEAFRQVAEAIPQPALFDTAKEFNADGAMVALDELRQQVMAMRAAVDSAAKELKKRKDSLAELEEAMFSGVEEFMKRRRAKLEAATVRQERQETREHARCSFEQHVGSACPICTNVSRALAIAAIDAPITAFTDVTSEAHRAAAVKANSIEASRLRDTAPALVAKALQIAGLYAVSADVVSTWSEDDRLEVLRWLEVVDPEHAEPPAALGMPHIAAEPGADHQSCHDCGAQLLHKHDANDIVVFYPAAALVGQHCTRELQAATPTPTETEASSATA